MSKKKPISIEKTIKESFNNFLFENLSFFSNKYKIMVGNNQYSSTAYYYYEPPHNIVIGKKILENIKKETDNEEHYINSFLFHEISHSFWSPPIKRVNNLLNPLKIPFEIYNLFEDARIEEKFRKTFKRDFLWNDYENFNSKDITPTDLFFYFIFTENEKYKLDNTKEKKLLSKTDIEKKEDLSDDDIEKRINTNKNFKKVKEYYLKTINLEIKDNYLELFKLIKNFYNEFKKELPKDKNKLNLSSFSNEFIVSDEMGYGEGTISDLKNNVKVIITNENNDKKIDKKIDENHQLNLEANDIPYDDLKNYDIFFNTNVNFVNKHLKLIEKKSQIILNNKRLKRLFKKKETIELKERYSKKMSINKLILEEDKIYKHKTIVQKGGRSTKAKKISIIVDTSGSMHSIANEVSTILYIFNKLAQKKLIELNIILSGSKNNFLVNYLLPIPIKDTIIASIKYIGAHEGFSKTFKEHQNLLRKSHYIFILTDGLITDNPLNKKELNSLGIYTRAIYIQNEKLRMYASKIEESLNKYFDEFILKENIEEIFNEIIIRFKRI